jgi:anti-anti-sigma factor
LSAYSLERPVAHVAVRNDDAIVTLSGELDLSNIEILAKPLGMALDAGMGVVLDLARVTRIDLFAVRLIETTAAQLRRRGRSLHVVDAAPQIRRVFFLTGATDLLS